MVAGLVLTPAIHVELIIDVLQKRLQQLRLPVLTLSLRYLLNKVGGKHPNLVGENKKYICLQNNLNNERFNTSVT